MNLFLDTSAVIKLYHKENGSEELVDILLQYEEDLVLTISDICKIEFHSAFLRRVRTKEIDREIIEQVFQYFEQDLAFYHIVEVNDKVKQSALSLLDEVAWEKGLRTLDAIQLASALTAQNWLPIAYFISADQKLLKIAKEHFTVFDPETRKTEQDAGA